jgi:hypothetical protein
MPVKPEIPFRQQSGGREKQKIGVHDVGECEITASPCNQFNDHSSISQFHWLQM